MDKKIIQELRNKIKHHEKDAPNIDYREHLPKHSKLLELDTSLNNLENSDYVEEFTQIIKKIEEEINRLKSQ